MLVPAAAEAVDRGQVDRQVVAVERQGARRRKFRRLWTSRPLRSRKRIVSGSSVERKRPASAVAAIDVPDRSSTWTKMPVQPRAAVLAAVDPQGQPLAEPVELADLDRRAERAGAQVEAQALRSDSGNKARYSRRSQGSAASARPRRHRAPAAAGRSRRRSRAAHRAPTTKRACGRRAGCRASARSGCRARNIRAADWPASARRR